MAGKKKSRTTLLAVAFILFVLALIVHSSLGLGKSTCEVCVEFRGSSKCRTAKGSTIEEARRTAIDNACTFLAGGVTDSLACANTAPTSVKCE